MTKGIETEIGAVTSTARAVQLERSRREFSMCPVDVYSFGFFLDFLPGPAPSASARLPSLTGRFLSAPRWPASGRLAFPIDKIY